MSVSDLKLLLIETHLKLEQGKLIIERHLKLIVHETHLMTKKTILIQSINK